MKNKVSIGLRHLLGLAGRAPYILGLNAAKLLGAVILPNYKISTRNSFALGYLTAGFSDLDLSLLETSATSTESLNQFLAKYQKLKKLIPILGEINIYRKNSLNFVARYHNDFELKRNPQVLSNIHPVKKPSEIQAAVFLLRQLEKDLFYLENCPRMRRNKWHYHWKQIHAELNLNYEFPFPEDNESLQDRIISIILAFGGIKNPVFMADHKAKLNFMLALLKSNFDISKAQPLIGLDPWLIAWWPHLFAQWDIKLIKLNPLQLSFFKRQVEWELCGIVTSPMENSGQVKTHLQHLKRLSTQICKYSEIDQEPLWLDDIFSDLEVWEKELPLS